MSQWKDFLKIRSLTWPNNHPRDLWEYFLESRQSITEGVFQKTVQVYEKSNPRQVKHTLNSLKQGEGPLGLP